MIKIFILGTITGVIIGSTFTVIILSCVILGKQSEENKIQKEYK